MNPLLDARQFRMLDGLRLKPRKSFGGRVRGERLTLKKGVSIEFADYREYSEGDDLRHLDWNVLARLDSAVMRTYRDEEDLAVHLLLDASPSMAFGDPDKLSQVQRLGAALGYVALNSGDAVTPRALCARADSERPLRGRVGYPKLARWIEATRIQETPETLGASLRAFATSSVRVGLVILLSDGLNVEMPRMVRAIGARGHELMFLQVLTDVELEPDLEGDLRLIDGEGGKAVEITANGSVLAEYKRRLANHIDDLHEATLRSGGRHAMVNSAEAVESVLRKVLKRQGWVE